MLNPTSRRHPKAEVHPRALYELQRNNSSTEGLRSKDWKEFAASDAPYIAYVSTVCDKAAAEACPVWPGKPICAHLGVEDPAAVDGDGLTRQAAFAKALSELRNRISIFVDLPLDSLDGKRLQEEIEGIGRSMLVDANTPLA